MSIIKGKHWDECIDHYHTDDIEMVKLLESLEHLGIIWAHTMVTFNGFNILMFRADD